MKTAVLMSRVSSEEQAQGYSLDVQEESLLKYCTRNNITVLNKFREDHSAKDFNRPEFKKFLEYAKKNKGRIDLLLITSWDRFSRNITDALLVLRRLKNLGISVQAIEQPIDLSIPENKVVLAMFLAIPEIDNDRRSIKIKQGMRAALKAGRWCRKAPRGYFNSRDEYNKPIIIPDERITYVKYLFEQIAQARTQVDVMRELNKKGYNLRKSNISKILRNPVYIGKIRVPADGEEPEQLVEGIHKGLIEEDIFNKVNKILYQNHQRKNKPKINCQRNELFLRGNVICSKCGNHLTGSRSRSRTRKRYFYYHCNNCKNERFRADKVNAIVTRVFGEFKFKTEAQYLYNEMLKELIGGSDIQRNKKILKLKEEKTKQEERISKLQDKFIDGIVSREDYDSMRLRYSNEKAEVALQLTELIQVKSSWKEYLEKGFGLLSNLEKTFNLADVQTKKEILSSIFPEKLIFEGNKCRTPRINEVLRHILLIDRRKHKNKSEQITELLDLSAKVELTGIELKSYFN